jgi:hypothetical protein
MTSDRRGAVAYIEADLREPETILAAPELDTLDLTQPVALLLIAILHFLDDADDPYGAVATLIEALPSGSYVVVSNFTLDPLPTDTIERITPLLAPDAGHGTFRPRTRDEVARFLHGLELVDPGLVPIVEWRPDMAPEPHGSSVQEVAVYGAVARLPGTTPASGYQRQLHRPGIQQQPFVPRTSAKSALKLKGVEASPRPLGMQQASIGRAGSGPRATPAWASRRASRRRPDP